MKLFDYIVVGASLVLMVAISVEILDGDPHTFAPWYIGLQFGICSIFITDFFISMALSANKWRYFVSHFIILVISLPYLSLPFISVEREGLMLIALMPILRAFVAMYILLRWLIRGEAARRILYAYILSVSSFTYVSALLFYDCEGKINPNVDGFGDAMWWAAMALTTTELTIVPYTVTAKVLSVALPLAGMMMLPIATNFLLSLRRGSSRD
ncbi:MAG: two pore domain potassium channel family protein [Rikenellaceae bacterium]